MITRIEIEMLIKRAFYGVTLDGGHTLVDIKEMSNWGERPTPEEIHSVPRAEFGNNWTVLPIETLDHFWSLAHADAKSMRYYLPAFMVSMLTHYEECSNRMITVLGSLCPDSSADFTISRFALFTDEQRVACALYLKYLPELIDLNRGDRKIVDRALCNYWAQYLPEKEHES